MAVLWPLFSLQEDNRGCVHPKAIVRLGGFGKWKNAMNSSERELATFRLAA
jgi:hypothetical protein